MGHTFDDGPQSKIKLDALHALAFAAIKERAAKDEILSKGVHLVHEGRLHQVTKMENDAGKEFRTALMVLQSLYPEKVAEAKSQAGMPLQTDTQ